MFFKHYTMEYQIRTGEDESLGTEYTPRGVHYWRPPCSCGVELGEALEVEKSAKTPAKEEVHFWRPPCSCGISLDEAID